MVVCPVVIQDHMNIQTLRHLPIDLAQELQKLDVPVSWLTGSDHFSFQHIEGCKKACGAIAFVVMGNCPATPFLHSSRP